MKSVLILVIEEDGLWDNGLRWGSEGYEVLILVIEEDGLWVFDEKKLSFMGIMS